MVAGDSTRQTKACAACAGFGWVYVTVKTPVATAPEVAAS